MNGGSTLPPPSPRTPRTATTNRPPWRWIGLGGAAALTLGSFLPWATVTSVFGSVSVAGTEGDGIMTLICGVIAVIGFAVQRPLLAIIPAAIGLAIGVIDLTNISRNLGGVDTEFARASVGVGLWILVAGAIVAVVAAALLISQRRSRERAAPPVRSPFPGPRPIVGKER